MKSETAQQPIIAVVFVLAAIGLSFFYLDLPVANFFHQDELQTIYYYSREITNVGYSIHYFVIALTGFIFSKWIYPKAHFFKKIISSQKNYTINQWSVFSIRTLFIIGLVLNLIKAFIGRQRPHSSISPNLIEFGSQFNHAKFDMFTLDSHWHSFPSGHSQVVFTVAAIALLIWPKQKYIFLVLAGLFALTRVIIHQHFLSDIIAGAASGYFGTLYLYRLWPPKISNP